MLYSTPQPSVYEGGLYELEQFHERLAGFAAQGPAWLPRFRRRARASAARSSAGLEGYRVPAAVAEALAEGRAAPTHRAERVVAGYAFAMQHVSVLATDPSFTWSTRLLLDLHFECCSTERRANPGRWRTGPVWMSAPEGGAAYQAPPAQDAVSDVGTLIDWLSYGDPGAPTVVRAAMAHLHLMALHPFADGNGRLARILHGLVLHRGGVPGPASVDERFARDPGRYYAVLQEVLGGRYQPGRSAAPWIRYCIDAHLLLAQEQLAVLETAARRWSALEAVITARGLPARLAVALEQSLSDGVDRASYATETDVAAATASTDLRRILDAGLVVRIGRARHTRYVASDTLRQLTAS